MKRLTFLFLFLITGNSFAFVPAEAYTFEFNVKTVGMGPLKEEKLYEAVELLRQVFASPEFKRRILRHRFNGRYRFAKNKGLTNRQIYNRILSGMEKLYPYRNNAMDVEVQLYTDYNSNVLGFTRPSTRRIWMNTKYYNRFTPVEIASNLTHEWLHKLGFDHERERTRNRKYSVPYAVGYIVKDIAEKYYDHEYGD